MLKPRYASNHYLSLCAQKSCNEPYVSRSWDVCDADSVANAYAKLNADFAYLSVVTNAVWLTLDPIGGGIYRSISAGLCINGGAANPIKCNVFPNVISVLTNIVPLGLVIDQVVQYREYVDLQNNYQNNFNTFCEPYKYYIDTDYDLNQCTNDVSLYKTSGICSLTVTLISSVYPYRPDIDLSPGFSTRFDGIVRYSKSVDTDYTRYTAMGQKIQECYSVIQQLYRPSQNFWYNPTDESLAKFFGNTDQVNCPNTYTIVQRIKTNTDVNIVEMFHALGQLSITLNPSQYNLDTVERNCNSPSISFNSPHSANRESIYLPPFPTCPDTLPICGEIFKLGLYCAGITTL